MLLVCVLSASAALVQGIMLMAAAPDSPGATNSKAFYQAKLAEAAVQWATCSNDGVGEHGDGKAYCRYAELLTHLLHPVIHQFEQRNEKKTYLMLL